MGQNFRWVQLGFLLQFSPSVVSNSLWSHELHQASLSITNSRSSPRLMSIESVMPSNHLILCCPLLLLPWIFPSIGDFSNKSALHIRWPKFSSFSFCISPSNEYPGLISFSIDWLDLLADNIECKPLNLCLHCCSFSSRDLFLNVVNTDSLLCLNKG